MECLDSKISKLYNLWISLGAPLDSSIVNNKLQHVLYEIDRVIEYEELQKRLLSADIEDIMANIERKCEILGVPLENILESQLYKSTPEFTEFHMDLNPSFSRQQTLFMLDSRLAHEIHQRRLHVKDWLSEIAQLVEELTDVQPFKPYEEYDDDMSWSTMQLISCALRDLSRVQMVRQNEFESAIRAIHYYWNILNVTPDFNDSVDVALSQTFEKIPIDIRIDESFIACKPVPKVYYHKNMHKPLSLASDIVAALKMKAQALQSVYNVRLPMYTKYVKGIRTIWEELNIPDEKRCIIHQSLDGEYLNELRINFGKLKAVVRSMTEEYIDKFKVKLETLWDKCLLTQRERDDFMNRLHELNTMDEVRVIVDEHIKYLQKIQHDGARLAKLMKERKELIQEMIDFEKTASDPSRLFRASFQLNQEERWRKTCFPTLLRLDDELIEAVCNFERISKKPFIVGERRYLDTLFDEIADRAANQTFFGFLNPEPAYRSTRNTTKNQEPRTKTHVIQYKDLRILDTDVSLQFDENQKSTAQYL
ncbi:carboxypeptidase C prc1 [Apophysomyces sp. BC1034]|nr:carboxypeptidase C prc1 [Apophysomyces sp. BC1034]